MAPQLRTIRRILNRRAVCLCVLFGMCASYFPLPLAPTTALAPSGKDLSEPFPCAHRSCGCRSAQKCWESCCCFSHAEKVAWARKHGVQIPGESSPQTAESLVRHAAPASQAAPACHASATANKVADCHATAGTQPATASASCPECPVTGTGESHESPETAEETLIGFFAEKCQGRGFYSHSLPVVTLSPAEPILFPVPRGDWLLPCSDRLTEQSLDPPVPPPRLLSI